MVYFLEAQAIDRIVIWICSNRLYCNFAKPFHPTVLFSTAGICQNSFLGCEPGVGSVAQPGSDRLDWLKMKGYLGLYGGCKVWPVSMFHTLTEHIPAKLDSR